MSIMEDAAVDRKIINITGKRQITIPLRFYEKLSPGKEIECVFTGDAIILRPLPNSNDGFAMEILKDLVSQGYSGDDLLAKFAEQSSNIRKAISTLIDEADEIAEGTRKGATTKDIFGEE